MKTLILILFVAAFASCTKDTPKPDTKQKQVQEIINAKKIS